MDWTTSKCKFYTQSACLGTKQPHVKDTEGWLITGTYIKKNRSRGGEALAIYLPSYGNHESMKPCLVKSGSAPSSSQITLKGWNSRYAMEYNDQDWQSETSVAAENYCYKGPCSSPVWYVLHEERRVSKLQALNLAVHLRRYLVKPTSFWSNGRRGRNTLARLEWNGKLVQNMAEIFEYTYS